MAANTAVPVPSKEIRVSWAAPPNISHEVDQPTTWLIPDSVMASPSTKPNGIAGTKSEMASIEARRLIDESTVMSRAPYRVVEISKQRFSDDTYRSSTSPNTMQHVTDA